MRNDVLQLLEAALAFAPKRDFSYAQFRVEWNEPDKGPVSEAVQKLQSEYQDSLPAKKKEYLSASLPRFRFVAAEAVKHFAPKGKVLDLGCAPGYVSIILHHLGFEPHGVDLNTLWEDTYPSENGYRNCTCRQSMRKKRRYPFPMRLSMVQSLPKCWSTSPSQTQSVSSRRSRAC